MVERYLIVGIALLTALLVGCAAGLLVLIGLPADCLRHRPTRRSGDEGRGAFAMVRMIARNLLGSMLVLVGAVLAIPLIPGPGFVFIVAGIFLIDFPDKHRTIRKLLNRPAVLQPINRLRAAFARAPLFVD